MSVAQKLIVILTMSLRVNRHFGIEAVTPNVVTTDNAGHHGLHLGVSNRQHLARNPDLRFPNRRHVISLGILPVNDRSQPKMFIGPFHTGAECVIGVAAKAVDRTWKILACYLPIVAR